MNVSPRQFRAAASHENLVQTVAEVLHVENMTTEADDATIVRTIIALGHNLGLEVVAEGVETAQQARALRAYQCDEAQGFLFARAVSAQALPRLITRSIPGRRA